MLQFSQKAQQVSGHASRYWVGLFQTGLLDGSRVQKSRVTKHQDSCKTLSTPTASRKLLWDITHGWVSQRAQFPQAGLVSQVSILQAAVRSNHTTNVVLATLHARDNLMIFASSGTCVREECY